MKGAGDMATYAKALTSDDVRCDDCSTFDGEGFPERGRAWAPAYGAPCASCGVMA